MSTASRRARRLLAIAALALIALLSLPSGAVQAHAVIVGTDPAENEVLDQTPDEIVLRFSEPVELLDDSLILVDDQGRTIDAGPVDQRGGSDTIVLEVGTELNGSVVVSWKAVSIDSHVISGAYSFAVGSRTEVDPSLVADTVSTTWPDRWLGVGRWATYLGVAGVVGGLAALVAMAPTLLEERRTRRLIRLAAMLGMVGTAVMLAAQSALIANGPFDPSSWSEVIDLTSGRWWVLRLLAFVGVAVAIGAVAGRRSRRAWYGLTIAATIVLVPTTVAGGHAAAGDHVAQALASTAVHLAAMAVWVGGLTLLALTVERRDLPTVFGRFSPIGLICVALLAVTGSINAWRQLGSPGDLLDTTFGRWLSVKLVVVLLVVVAAFFNRWSVRRGDLERAQVERRLRRGVGAESIGMAVVLAATAGLSNSTPPPSVIELPQPISMTAVQDDVQTRIDVLPARTGGTTLNVILWSDDGELPPADEITVRATLDEQDLGPISIDTETVGPNQVTADQADFPAPGEWTIEVTARFGEFDQTVLSAPVEIG